MTKSRKLFVAAMLLAGGYGAAIALSRLSELVYPGVDSSTATSRGAGLISTLKGFVAHGGTASTTGELVPEANAAPRFSQDATTAARRPAEQPTWLAATPPANVPVTVASQPGCAAPPALSDSRPIGIATDSNIVESAHLGPVARITDVSVASAASASRPASPRDRWPRWGAGDGSTVKGSVATTFHDSSAVTSREVQAIFRRADVAHKNRPALDRGDVADGAGGRTHVVVDGDSLPRLADRYLDDADLADEIYRLNRDVLASPDLLPIGVELRMPDHRRADSPAAPRSTDSLAATKQSVPSGMVPVERRRNAVENAPRAELLRPIPAPRVD